MPSGTFYMDTAGDRPDEAERLTLFSAAIISAITGDQFCSDYMTNRYATQLFERNVTVAEFATEEFRKKLRVRALEEHFEQVRSIL